jgi:hypothetical protein
MFVIKANVNTQNETAIESHIMKSHTCSEIAALQMILVAIIFVGLLANSATAGFALIDDFESYTAGSAIDGQGYWRAEAGANAIAAGVTTDPLSPSNRVMNIGAGGYPGGRLGHRETINTDPGLRILQGSTATLFFRVAWDTEQVDTSIGMTDVANPISDVIFNSFTQFESQLAFAFTPGSDQLAVRDGGNVRTLTTSVAPLNWYNVWMVINNITDTTQVFVQGGSFANQTQLAYLGSTSFLFRNGATNNNLLTFFIATGRNTSNQPPNPTENIGPVYVDDLYIDRAGINLLNPVPEPGVNVLCGSAALVLISVAIRRWRVRIAT